MAGAVDTPAGKTPRVTATLSADDRRGGRMARWGVGRMDYRVDPGLYALGNPGADSPVLVSANYKLSFDALRSALPGLDAWLLAADTDGINVWCAAGKGKFSAEAVAAVAKVSGLERVVSHRTLILPQLAAPGVAAHQIKALCGFKGVFGPVEARDIPAFLSAGMKAAPAMRRKNFPLADRLTLVPMELVIALKYGLIIALALALLGGLGGPGFLGGVLTHGLMAAAAAMAAVLAGAVAGPLLLPWLPGRAFAAKGLWLGLAVAAILLALGRPAWAEGAGWALIMTALTSFLLMNFTGASTYTSLSGVKKEMRWAVPTQAVCAGLGLAAWLTGLFLA